MGKGQNVDGTSMLWKSLVSDGSNDYFDCFGISTAKKEDVILAENQSNNSSLLNCAVISNLQRNLSVRVLANAPRF